MARASSTSSSAGYIVLAVFGIFWCSTVGLFDFVIIRNLAGQLYTTTFDTTPGVLMRPASLEAENKDEEAGVVRYRYEVGGKTYLGHRFRYYDGESPSHEDRELAAVRALREGAKCVVYFDPRRPTQSVLRTGWGGSDLFLLMFTMPFNAVALGIVSLAVMPLRRRMRPTELPGIKILRDGMRTSVRLPTVSPVVAAIAALAAASFVMVFIVAFAGSGFYPTLPLAIAAWAVVLALAMGVFVWRRSRMQAGMDDLVLDRSTGKISLPVTLGRKERVTFPWAEVRGVEVFEEVTRNSEGSSTSYYLCFVRDSGAEMERVKLARCFEPKQADCLVSWLQKEMSLPSSPGIHPGHQIEPALKN